MIAQKMQDETFRKLRDFIHEKSGIYISDNKKYLLENRLHRRLQERGLKSYEDYLYLIQYSADSNELKKLFDVVTTNETYFFREPQHFDILVKHIIPSIVSSRAKTFKIWSAACSTGEEPYTIAMLLKENPSMTSIRTEIIGTDISDAVLQAAKRGVYSSYAVRNIPPNFFKKYFRDANGVYTLDPSIKRMVRFQNVNLIDEKSMRMFRNFDVIFCRNVLIYFDENAKKKVVSLLYDALKPGGYLFIGASESLHNVTRAFKPLVINRTVVYQRV